jgi:hypothetical protein
MFAGSLLIGALGTTLKFWTQDPAAVDPLGFAASSIGDFLVFFGVLGAGGIFCLILFDSARIERAEFWTFLAGLVGAIFFFWMSATPVRC